MICKRCFRMSDDGFEYCPYCGKSFKDDSEIEIKHDDTEKDSIDTPPKSDGPAYRPDSVPQGDRPRYDYTMPPPRTSPPPYIPPYGTPYVREKTPTERFFSAIGHAVLYFLLFFICQTIVSAVYMSSVSATIIQEQLEAAGVENVYDLDYDEYNAILDAANEELMHKLYGDGNSIITIASGVLLVIILLLIAKAKKRTFSEHTGFYPVRTWKILLLFPLGIATQFLSVLAINMVRWPDWAIEEFNQTYEFIGADNGTVSLILEILSVAVFAPLAEELIFRGCIYTRLRRGMPVTAAVILSAFAFGLAHGVLIAVCYAAVLGLMLAYVYEKFDSVFAPIALHMGFNLANYIPLMNEDSSGAEIILTLVLSAVVFVITSSVIILSDVHRKKQTIPEDTNYPNYPNYPNM